MDLYSSLTHLPREDIPLLKRAQQGEPLHALLLDSSKMSDEEFLRQYPDAKPHPFLSHVYYYKKETHEFGKSLIYDLGVISIQDASAMAVPYFLNPSENDRVLDMCAAPGGKTIFASLLMKKKGCVLANDISYSRAKALSSNIERMGLGNVTVVSSDLSIYQPRLSGLFSKIILDAPCSGSAMFRKDDYAEEVWSLEKVKQCAEIQKKLLENAYHYLCQGGTIVYSTCSFSYEENEAVLLEFLENHPDMRPVSVPEFNGVYHPRDLKEAVYLLPHLYPGEGQFFCLLAKEGSLNLPALKQGKSENVSDPLILSLLSRYHMDGLIVESHGDHFYGTSSPLDLKSLPVLRAGVDLFAKENNRYLPSHHFARCVNPSLAIELDKKQAAAFLYGDTFPLVGEKGFHVVSYQGIPMGWVKIVNGIAKNHYPKGLRFKYEI